jgi:hypothetical protein
MQHACFVSLAGTLPPASSGYTDFSSINMKGTSITGILPETWSLFPALQVIDMDITGIRCDLFRQENHALVCNLPGWLDLSHTTSEVIDPATTFTIDGLHCPLMEIQGRDYSSVVLPPTFYSHVFCICDPTYFGLSGQCVPCPQPCRCSGSVVQVSAVALRACEAYFGASLSVLVHPASSCFFRIATQ